MSTETTREAFRFMLDHAGYSTPPGRAACALELARAEALLTRAIGADVASVRWVDDDEDMTPLESSEDMGPFGCIVGCGEARYQVGDFGPSAVPFHEHERSLWGIVVGPRGTDDPYCRVVAAELASELRDELRAALGLRPGGLRRSAMLAA